MRHHGYRGLRGGGPVDVQRLASTFVDLADTLVDDFDVYGLLHVLTTRCVEVLDVDAAGLLLADHESRLQLICFSDHSGGLAELLGMQAAQGPCVECYGTGEPITLACTSPGRTRWPEVAAAVADEGFACLTALPMRLRGQLVGVLVLLGSTCERVSGQNLRLAQALADAATIAIVTNRLAHERRVLAEQLQTALDTQVQIEQAKGVLAHHLGLDPDEAFELLRVRARITRRRLVEVAEDVASGNVSEFTAEPLKHQPPEGI